MPGANKKRAAKKKAAPRRSAIPRNIDVDSKTKARASVPRVTRDTMIFVCGLAGVFHETVIREVERPTLLILFSAMIGLPAFLRSDEKKE